MPRTWAIYMDPCIGSCLSMLWMQVHLPSAIPEGSRLGGRDLVLIIPCCWNPEQLSHPVCRLSTTCRDVLRGENICPPQVFQDCYLEVPVDTCKGYPLLPLMYMLSPCCPTLLDKGKTFLAVMRILFAPFILPSDGILQKTRARSTVGGIPF